MPQNSQQLRRYYLIFKCMSEYKYPSMKCIEKYLIDKDAEASERTISRAMTEMRTKFNIWPTYDNQLGGYYFSEEDEKYMSGALRFLEMAFISDNLNTGNYAKYISYGEADLLRGIELVPELLKAIDQKTIIEFEHENYQKETLKKTRLEPYLIREYLNRWYVIGFKSETKQLRTYGVDRINELRLLPETFKKPEETDIHSLFESVIGIVYNAEGLLKIEFKVPLDQKKYLDSLPLHKSQIHLHDLRDEAFYQIEVVANYELEQKLLMHSNFITITNPKDYAKYFGDKLQEMAFRYN